DTPDKRELLDLVDVLVDGPFIQRLYHHDLAFRGSANQRIIDLRASRKVRVGAAGGADSAGWDYAAEPVLLRD
ncbi:MAG: radical SAM protein, partial [Trueperella sp.]|uniref:4Fe-4S cluster-binding domain-containing protein n=1 Tax=Trueperella sp. TaxID=2699835 RepID=UPI0025D898F9